MNQVNKVPKKKRQGQDKGSADGTVIQTRRLRNWSTSTIHVAKARVRSGGFEWRYGRSQCAKYHAGSEFARIWEKAGIASACAATLDGTAGGGGWSGVPESRMLALDRIMKINQALGHGAIQRLVAYVVEGKTPKEIVTAYPGSSDRGMANALDIDLHDLARIMNYL